MAKFTEQQKIRAVQGYFEGIDGQKTIAKSIGVHHAVLLKKLKALVQEKEELLRKKRK